MHNNKTRVCACVLKGSLPAIHLTCHLFWLWKMLLSWQCADSYLNHVSYEQCVKKWALFKFSACCRCILKMAPKEAQQFVSLPQEGSEGSIPHGDQALSQLALTNQAQPAGDIKSGQQKDLLQPEGNDVIDTVSGDKHEKDAIDSINQSMKSSMHLGLSSGRRLEPERISEKPEFTEAPKEAQQFISLPQGGSIPHGDQALSQLALTNQAQSAGDIKSTQQRDLLQPEGNDVIDTVSGDKHDKDAIDSINQSMKSSMHLGLSSGRRLEPERISEKPEFTEAPKEAQQFISLPQGGSIPHGDQALSQLALTNQAQSAGDIKSRQQRDLLQPEGNDVIDTVSGDKHEKDAIDSINQSMKSSMHLGLSSGRRLEIERVSEKPEFTEAPKEAQQFISLPQEGSEGLIPHGDQALSQLALTNQAQPAGDIKSRQQKDLLQPEGNDVIDTVSGDKHEKDAIDSINPSMKSSMHLGLSSGRRLEPERISEKPEFTEAPKEAQQFISLPQGGSIPHRDQALSQLALTNQAQSAGDIKSRQQRDLLQPEGNDVIDTVSGDKHEKDAIDSINQSMKSSMHLGLSSGRRLEPERISEKPEFTEAPKEAQQFISLPQGGSIPHGDQALSQLALTNQAQSAGDIKSRQQKDLLQPKNNDVIEPESVQGVPGSSRQSNYNLPAPSALPFLASTISNTEIEPASEGPFGHLAPLRVLGNSAELLGRKILQRPTPLDPPCSAKSAVVYPFGYSVRSHPRNSLDSSYLRTKQCILEMWFPMCLMCYGSQLIWRLAIIRVYANIESEQRIWDTMCIVACRVCEHKYSRTGSLQPCLDSWDSHPCHTVKERCRQVANLTCCRAICATLYERPHICVRSSDALVLLVTAGSL